MFNKIDPIQIAGILLAILIFFGGQYYFAAQRAKQIQERNAWLAQHPEVLQEQAPAPASVAPAPTAYQTPTATAPAPVAAGDAEPAPAPDVRIAAAHLDIALSSAGATIKTAVLPQEWTDPVTKAAKGLEVLAPIEVHTLPFGLERFEIGPADAALPRLVLDQPNGPRKALNLRVWKLDSNSGAFDTHGDWKAVYSCDIAGGQYSVTKTFTLNKENAFVRAELAVANHTAQPVTYSYRLFAAGGILLDAPKSTLRSGVAPLSAALAGRDAPKNGEEAASPDVLPVYPDGAAAPSEEKRAISREENVWAAVKNRFYMADFISLKPRQLLKLTAFPVRNEQSADERLNEKNIGILAERAASPELAANATSAPDEYAFYVGPAEESRLEEAETALKAPEPLHLGQAILYCDYFFPPHPWVDWLARQMLWLFRGIYSAFGSFGLAVVLTTLVIKLCLHPMTRKMMISMNKMQKLQPEIKKIQEKYKGKTDAESRRKAMMEQQDLMKKAGANPAAGCLPMFIQLPVFSALYGIFNHAFQVRGATFLWVKDLSQPDHFTDLPFWPHVLNLLPILYIGLSFLQTRLTPQAKSDDPQQEMNRKMMMFMPVLLSLMFYSMPAGLMLYFAASAVFGTLENWYIRKKLLKQPDGPAVAVMKPGLKPPPPVKG